VELLELQGERCKENAIASRWCTLKLGNVNKSNSYLGTRVKKFSSTALKTRRSLEGRHSGTDCKVNQADDEKGMCENGRMMADACDDSRSSGNTT